MDVKLNVSCAKLRAAATSIGGPITYAFIERCNEVKDTEYIFFPSFQDGSHAA